MTNDLSVSVRCPDSPRELGLDFDAWWPGQQQTIDMIMDALVARGKRYVMAAIPTGGGKTIIASAVQKLLARAEGSGTSLVLTHTIQLQQQYTKTLAAARVVTGRRNHLCELPEDAIERMGVEPPMTAEDAPCAEGLGCPTDPALDGPGGCGYYSQLDEAAWAQMTVMNYAFAGRILRADRLKGFDHNPFHRDLLVMDESHLAEEAITEAAGTKLWMGTLNRLNVRLPDLVTRVEALEGGPRSQKTVLYENVAVWRAWATEQRDKLRPRIGQLRRAFEHTKTREAKSALKSAEAVSMSLALIAGIENPDEWIIRRDKALDGRRVVSVTVKPLWGRSVAEDMLFRHFSRVLLMSATPGDPNIARIMLGIPQDNFEYIERPSTFPVENRPVIYWPVAKLNYSSDNDDWDRVAKAIGFIATRPENVARKGLVHSGSAANAKKIVALLDRYLPGRAFTHIGGPSTDTAMGRDDALTHFVTSPEPLILVTASFTTGLDLPYLIGWQAIAKVPFGSLGDEITAKRRAFKLGDFAFGQKAYEAACANTVVQAAGRVVRSATDSGPTYILDGNWDLVARKAYLPQFFLDAVQRFRVQ